MSPIVLLVCGIIAVVIGVIGALLNIGTAASRMFTNTVSVFVIHGLCGLLYIGGAISIVTSIIMFLINFAKH